MVDVRRELDNINKHLDRHVRSAGEAVVWYEFLPLGQGSVYDDVYDESPRGSTGLAFKPGVVIPTIYVEEVEDQNRAIESGRQPTQNLAITVSMKDLRNKGIVEPEDYQAHLKDMFLYDGRYYNVVEYRVRGRLRDDVIVGIEGKETYIDQERPNDVLTGTEESIQNLPWPNRLPR